MKKQQAVPLDVENGDVKCHYKNIYPIAPFQIYEDSSNANNVRRPSSAEWADGASSSNAVSKLCNRMIMCVFAICILWLTSLQICVAIVGTNIKIPSFSAVVTNCKYAYAVVQEQSDFYAACTQRQIDICTDNLDAAFVQETFRVQENQQINLQYLNAYQNMVNNCSSSVGLAKGAVSAWSGLGVQYVIPYFPNCTGTYFLHHSTQLNSLKKEVTV